MALFAKDPHAVLDYSVDWTDALAEGETMTVSEWRIEPEEDGGPVVAGESGAGAVRTATLSGGVAGHRYRLSNRITTSAGRSDERSLTIRIVQR